MIFFAGSTRVGHPHQRPPRRTRRVAAHHGPQLRLRGGAQRHHQPLQRGPNLLIRGLHRVHSAQAIARPASTASALDSRPLWRARQRRRPRLPPCQFRHVFFPRRAASVRAGYELGRAHVWRRDHRRDCELLRLGATSLYRTGGVGQARIVKISSRAYIMNTKHENLPLRESISLFLISTTLPSSSPGVKTCNPLGPRIWGCKIREIFAEQICQGPAGSISRRRQVW